MRYSAAICLYRQRQTDRQTDRQRQTDRDRQRQTETDRDRRRQTETDTGNSALRPPIKFVLVASVGF